MSNWFEMSKFWMGCAMTQGVRCLLWEHVTLRSDLQQSCKQVVAVVCACDPSADWWREIGGFLELTDQVV